MRTLIEMSCPSVTGSETLGRSPPCCTCEEEEAWRR